MKELEILKQKIKTGKINLPDPPPQKVKNRKILLKGDLDISGDRIDDMQYFTEFAKIVNWCLYLDFKTIQENFKNCDFFIFHNYRVYHFDIKPENLVLIVI